MNRTENRAQYTYEDELDALIEFCGHGLRLDRDEEAPMLWAVWEDIGDGEEDILGAGDSPSEAIEEARQCLHRRSLQS